MDIIFSYFNPNAAQIPDDVEFSVKQAALFNDRVHLLTNIPAEFEGVRVVDLSPYLPACFELERHYIPASDFSGAYLWFQRWYIVLAYCKAVGIESLAYFDGDVLLYEDIGEIPGIRTYDFLSGSVSWNGQVVINNLRVLERYVELVDQVYRDKTGALHDIFLEISERKNRGERVDHGFCDMTVSRFLTESNEFSFHYLDRESEIGFFAAKVHLYKHGDDVAFLDGKPYWVHPEGAQGRLHTMHFSGRTRWQLPLFTTAVQSLPAAYQFVIMKVQESQKGEASLALSPRAP